MSERRSVLSTLCGGRFGFASAEACDHAELSNVAFRLYATVPAQANRQAICALSLKAIAGKHKVGQRASQHRNRELELAGRIEQLHSGDKPVGMFRVIRDVAERKAVQINGAPNAVERQPRKTRSAKPQSHPRGEMSFAENKKGLIGQDLNEIKEASNNLRSVQSFKLQRLAIRADRKLDAREAA